MKIAIFTYGFEIGGVERLFVNLANAIVAQGHDVCFVVRYENGPFRKELDSRVRLTVLNCRIRSAFFPLRRTIALEKPDVWIVGPDFPAVISVLVHLSLPGVTRLVLTQHNYFDVDMRKSMGAMGKLVPCLVPLLWKKSDKVVAVSDGILEFLASRGVPRNRLLRIYNPVDASQIKQKSQLIESAHQAVIDWLGETPCILFLGRMTKVKNLPHLVRAFALLRQDQDVKLIMVGDGFMRSEVQAEVDRLGMSDSILLAGEFHNPYPLLACAKLLVLPSFSEALPTVVIEAMALGKPVVSTPTGAREILFDGRLGTVVNDFHNEKALATAMRAQLERPLTELELQAYHARVADFSMPSCLGQYLDLCTHLSQR